MLTEQVAHYIVELTAAVDLLSGTRSSNLDDLLELRLPLPETTSPPKTGAVPGGPAGSQGSVIASSPAAMVEIRMRVTITGLLMEERNPAFDSSQPEDPAAPPATIRAPWIEERFDLYAPEFERALENEAVVMARRHLGAGGWMITESRVALGSVEWLLVLAVPAYGAIANYSGFKQSVRELFNDVTVTLPNQTRRLARKLFAIEDLPTRTSDAPPAVKVAEAAATDASAETGRARAETAAADQLREMNASLRLLVERVGALEARLPPVSAGQPTESGPASNHGS